MKILVTGGLGYIGSHVTSLLLEQKIDVICIDNLDNSRLEVLEGINNITQKRPLFKNLDLKDKAKVECLFKEHDDIQAIIHFAAHKSVTESLEKPLSYYNNNIIGLLNILNFSVEKTFLLFIALHVQFMEMEKFLQSMKRLQLMILNLHMVIQN